MKSILLLVVGVSFAVVATTSAADPPKVGDDAPDFTMVGSDGKTYKLADFKGKQAVVVAWFPRAFTGGCTKNASRSRRKARKIREFDVAYFTASNDQAEKTTRSSPNR